MPQRVGDQARTLRHSRSLLWLPPLDSSPSSSSCSLRFCYFVLDAFHITGGGPHPWRWHMAHGHMSVDKGGEHVRWQQCTGGCMTRCRRRAWQGAARDSKGPADSGCTRAGEDRTSMTSRGCRLGSRDMQVEGAARDVLGVSCVHEIVFDLGGPDPANALALKKDLWQQTCHLQSSCMLPTNFTPDPGYHTVTCFVWLSFSSPLTKPLPSTPPFPQQCRCHRAAGWPPCNAVVAAGLSQAVSRGEPDWGDCCCA